MMELIPSNVQKIMVAPLNWGLGHATRCIPIISELLEHNKEVILGGDGESLELLKEEYPQLSAFSLPPYNVRYESSNLSGIILKNGLNVLSAISKESKSAKRIATAENIDMIISDSRFGFRTHHCRSVIISHQLAPHSNNRLLKSILEKGNRYYLNAFDECWIPDTESHKWSGELSTNPKIKNVKYIGPLSRLKRTDTIEKYYDISIILSGPEPARTKLENELLKLTVASNKKICLVRGTRKGDQIVPTSNVKIYDLVNSSEIADILQSSHNIISRSGYSSIMDYARMGVAAYLIPTPGQTEQEYLAERLDGQYGFRHISSIEIISAIFKD